MTNFDKLDVLIAAAIIWLIIVTWAIWPVIKAGLAHHHTLQVLFGG